jgi:hypothetical protein
VATVQERAPRFTLADCDGKRVAVSLSMPTRICVLCGQAAWTQDPTLGQVLQIAFDDQSSATSMLISPKEWQGEVVSDTQHGCNFLIILTHSS